MIGLGLLLCLTVFTSAVVLADIDNSDDPPVLQGDSPGVHQCPRDNYDDNTGSTNRNGVGGDF